MWAVEDPARFGVLTGLRVRWRLAFVRLALVVLLVSATNSAPPRLGQYTRDPMAARAVAADSAGAEGSAGNELPAGVMEAVSRTLGADEPAYHVQRNGVADSVVLSNYRHDLSARFTADGTVEIDAGPARVGLRLTAWGFGLDQVPVPAIDEMRADGNDVTFRRGSLSEWYVNGPAGLQHGYTLAAPPPAADEGVLTLSVELGGNVTAAVTDDADGLSLVGPDGVSLNYAHLLVVDARGTPLPAWLSLADANTMLVNVVAGTGSAYPITVDPLIQQAKLTASDADVGDSFGASIAVDGDVVVVGAPGDGREGAVYVFERSADGSWADLRLSAKLVADDAHIDDRFGISVAIEGDVVIAGAPGRYSEGGRDGSGAVYVFRRPAGGGWADAVQTVKLSAPDGQVGDAMGSAVAIDGNIIVAGAPGADVGAEDPVAGAGAVHVFERPTGGDWSDAFRTGLLRVSEPLVVDHVGASVAIEGNIVVAGAPDGFADDLAPGAVYVFARSGGEWPTSEVAKLTASDSGPNRHLGASVAIAGGTIVGGAPGEFSDPVGALYVFTRIGDAWSSMTESAQLTAEESVTGRLLGRSVAIDGDTIVGGAPSSANVSPGVAHVFVRSGDGWDAATTARLTASSRSDADELGASVAIGGGVVLAGAPIGGTQSRAGGDSDTVTAATGMAYAFAKPTGPWRDAAESAALRGRDADANADLGASVAIDGDTLVVGAPGDRERGITSEGFPANLGVGAVYVFVRPASGWSNARQIAKLMYPHDTQSGRPRVGTAVAIDDDTIVAGAPGADSGQGAVYLFVKPDSGWADATQTAKLSAVPGGSSLGISVAITGATIAAGAGEGAVHVYVRPPGGWVDATQSTTLTAPNAAGSLLGHSVAVSDSAIAAGAPFADEGRGAVYVYAEPTGGWSDLSMLGPTAKLGAGSAVGAEQLGLSVAMSGDGATIVAGAPGGSETPAFLMAAGGGVYVFARPPGGWIGEALTETAKLSASDAGPGDAFGDSVAIDGERIVVGAPWDDDHGSVYVFDRSGPQWRDAVETEKHTAAGVDFADRVGTAVDVQDDHVVVGAPGDDDGASEHGAAYVFTEPTPEESQFAVTPTAFHFGTVLPFATDSIRTVAIVNTGSTPVPKPSVSIQSSAAAGVFAVVRDGCTLAEIPVGASCTMVVRFSPDGAGGRTGSLTLSAGGKTRRAPLTGAGSAQVVIANPGVCPPGCVTTLSGTGFPSSWPIRVRFGSHREISGVISSPEGTFTVSVVVFRGEDIGNSRLSVSASGTPVMAATNLLVARGTVDPPDFLSRR